MMLLDVVVYLYNSIDLCTQRYDRSVVFPCAHFCFDSNLSCLLAMTR